jgi:hypothetical protein
VDDGTLDKREPIPALGREDRGLKRKHVVPDKNRTDENCQRVVKFSADGS